LVVHQDLIRKILISADIFGVQAIADILMASLMMCEFMIELYQPRKCLMCTITKRCSESA